MKFEKFELTDIVSMLQEIAHEGFAKHVFCIRSSDGVEYDLSKAKIIRDELNKEVCVVLEEPTTQKE